MRRRRRARVIPPSLPPDLSKMTPKQRARFRERVALLRKIVKGQRARHAAVKKVTNPARQEFHRSYRSVRKAEHELARLVGWRRRRRRSLPAAFVKRSLARERKWLEREAEHASVRVAYDGGYDADKDAVIEQCFRAFGGDTDSSGFSTGIRRRDIVGHFNLHAPDVTDDLLRALSAFLSNVDGVTVVDIVAHAVYILDA